MKTKMVKTILIFVIGWLGLFAFANYSFATDCDTDCKKACTNRWNILDGACFQRCLLEKKLHCETGVNGCTLHKAPPNGGYYLYLSRSLQILHDRNVITGQKHCFDLVDGGGLLATIADTAGLIDAGAFSLAIKLGVQFSKCACNEVQWGTIMSGGKTPNRDPQLVGGTTRDIAVGSNGDVWLVDNDEIDDSNHYGGMIRKNTGGSTWNDLKAFIRTKKIAVAPNGTVWMVNGKGEIHFLRPNDKEPTLCGGTVRDIAVGKNGDVWIVDNEEIPDSNSYGGMIRKNTGGCTWDGLKPNIRCTNIAVAPDGTVWMVNGVGHVHSLSPNGELRQRGASARDVAVGANGDVWIVDNDTIPDSNLFGGMIRRNTGDNNWDDLRTNIRAMEIAVAPDGTVWMVNGAGHVHRLNK